MTATPRRQAPLHPRAGSSGKAVLLTILGEFVLPAGGAVWTSTLVEAGRLLGIEEKNARQAVMRLAADAVLERERSGRRVRWTLTASGRSLLEAGTERIFGFGNRDDEWDSRWLVALVPIGEDRALRQKLRSRMAFLGFGSLGSGLFVSPHVHREKDVYEVLDDLALVDVATSFHADIGALGSRRDIVQRAWDLDDLAERYEGFVAEFAKAKAKTDEAAFVAVTRLVHTWRRFPFVDPELPAELLPRHWPGTAAKRLFDRVHEELAPAARRHFAAVEAEG